MAAVARHEHFAGFEDALFALPLTAVHFGTAKFGFNLLAADADGCVHVRLVTWALGSVNISDEFG